MIRDGRYICSCLDPDFRVSLLRTRSWSCPGVPEIELDFSIQLSWPRFAKLEATASLSLQEKLRLWRHLVKNRRWDGLWPDNEITFQSEQVSPDSVEVPSDDELQEVGSGCEGSWEEMAVSSM